MLCISFDCRLTCIYIDAFFEHRFINNTQNDELHVLAGGK